ncbi:hypothetical protein EHQ59_09595 [Leptospira kemamanensis]|uniref:DUF6933 domain-containing protein n=1 Tax=Leptospira kemamanensis TaxID=2484942 RepID=A0A4R9JQH5_9LEPT|nr:hypothetical protein [Leptospira kemamanensis]TGL52295.1 hypothetical protein EHQ59_09595 [Leptospira kemamanensis]
MILRLTKKVQDNFKLKNLQPIPENNLEKEWYVHTFTAGRLKYYLVTHAETLFSVFFRGAGIRSEGEFLDRIIQEFKRQLEDESFSAAFSKLVVPQAQEIKITSTVNRRIIGSMQDMIQMSKFIINDDPSSENTSPFGMSKFVNRTPFSFLGMDDPKTRMEKYK